MGLILFVAELGSGFGHVRRLLPVARAASALGHQVTFLVSRPDEVAPLLSGEGFSLAAVPAPARVPRGAARRGQVAVSFADVLGGAGFADPEYLAERANDWDRVLAELRPDAIVCELSPFLNLATFGGEVPVLVLGHGFALPPPHLLRFPPLWPGQPLHDEGALLDHAASVCRARGRPVPAALPALFAGSAHAVTGLAVLDPYRAERLRVPLGPPGVEVRPSEAAPTDDVFVYLLGDAASTLPVLRALAAFGARGRAFVRRGRPEHREVLRGSDVLWLERPEPIADALDRARVVVHHGSMLTTEESLLAGRSQIVVPLYLEHLLTARALGELGVATVARSARDADGLARTLAAGLGDEAQVQRARAHAEAHARAHPPDPRLPALLLREVLALAGPPSPD